MAEPSQIADSASYFYSPFGRREHPIIYSLPGLLYHVHIGTILMLSCYTIYRATDISTKANPLSRMRRDYVKPHSGLGSS